MISRNLLQQDKYNQAYFLYYFTEIRKQYYNEIIEFLKTKKQILINSAQGSGKSYFLSDLVLRQRILGSDSEFRILYINSSENYLKQSRSYLFLELLATVSMDFDENSKWSFCVLEKLPKIIENPKKLLDCLFFVKSSSNNAFPKNIIVLLTLLKEYYNTKGKKFVLIWDQVNELYRKTNEYHSEIEIYKMLDNNECFDCCVIGSTNNVKDIIIRLDLAYEDDFIFELNPFLMFSTEKKELLPLIYEEAIGFHPKDNNEKDILSYAEKLFNYLEGSLTEYYYYPPPL